MRVPGRGVRGLLSARGIRSGQTPKLPDSQFAAAYRVVSPQAKSPQTTVDSKDVWELPYGPGNSTPVSQE